MTDSAVIPEQAAASPVSVPPSPAIFRDFYLSHVDFVCRASKRFGVDEEGIDDVVQNVFWVAYRRFADLRQKDFPDGSRRWMSAILVRVVHDYRRTTRRKRPHLQLPHSDPELLADPRPHAADEALVRAEAAHLARRLLDKLTEREREVFVLAELEELTTREIAASLGVKPSLVYSRLKAARRDFQRAAACHRRRDAHRLRCSFPARKCAPSGK